MALVNAASKVCSQVGTLEVSPSSCCTCKREDVLWKTQIMGGQEPML